MMRGVLLPVRLSKTSLCDAGAKEMVIFGGVKLILIVAALLAFRTCLLLPV